MFVGLNIPPWGNGKGGNEDNGVEGQLVWTGTPCFGWGLQGAAGPLSEFCVGEAEGPNAVFHRSGETTIRNI